jgi:hypothetical protein
MTTFVRQKTENIKINKLIMQETIVKIRDDDYKLMHRQLKSLRTNTVSSDRE